MVYIYQLFVGCADKKCVEHLEDILHKIKIQ